mmetsp:Transcript_68272/g.191265  ORF Transcript_68272/g.191265 Transcript_68272/m.191265 type:complete len:239 (-) Transcript_68272:30-746(-)
MFTHKGVSLCVAGLPPSCLPPPLPPPFAGFCCCCCLCASFRTSTPVATPAASHITTNSGCVVASSVMSSMFAAKATQSASLAAFSRCFFFPPQPTAQTPVHSAIVMLTSCPVACFTASPISGCCDQSASSVKTMDSSVTPMASMMPPTAHNTFCTLGSALCCTMGPTSGKPPATKGASAGRLMKCTAAAAPLPPPLPPWPLCRFASPWSWRPLPPTTPPPTTRLGCAEAYTAPLGAAP